MSSRPTDSLIRLGVIPKDCLSFSPNTLWVVVVGWVTKDLVSPRLLETSNNFKALINLKASFLLPLILKATMVPPWLCCFLASAY